MFAHAKERKLAADTPVRLGKNGIGGARPNSGPRKGMKHLNAQDLRKQVKKVVGIPFEQVLAEMQLQLFTDFKAGANIREAVMFTASMMKYMVKPPSQEVEVKDITPKDMADAEIELKAAALIARAKFNSQTATDETTEQK